MGIIVKNEESNKLYYKEGQNTPEDSKVVSVNEARPSDLSSRAGLIKVFPRIMQFAKEGTIVKPNIVIKKSKPVVLDTASLSVDNGSMIENGRQARVSLYASVQGNSVKTHGPRTSESLCQRLIQGSMMNKRTRCNYFQIKTGKFVSPKIVKASRRYCPKTVDSFAALHYGSDIRTSPLLEQDSSQKPKRKGQPLLSEITPRNKKTVPQKLIGKTDKSKVKKEEIRRIFKLSQFKKRVASDLFLDNYRKRISLKVTEALKNSPRDIHLVSRDSCVTAAPFRSFSSNFTGQNIELRGNPEAQRVSLNLSEKLKRTQTSTATSSLLQKLQTALVTRKEASPPRSNIRVLEDYTVTETLL